jgi:NADH-quinone oxidoreductase subunit J
MDALFFFLFSAIAIACGVSVVLQKHPIHSALSLIGVMCSLAFLYLLLGAEFIAAAQVIVYAGAIMVLFLFVIMLLNAGAEQSPGRSWMARLAGFPALASFLALVAYIIQRSLPQSPQVRFGEFLLGGPRDIGQALFTRYVLPFEATTALILIAIVGAVVLARKELD